MDVMKKATNDKRLIDANKLIKNGIRVSYGFDNYGVLLIPMGDVIRSIKNAPTINAVEVVRCRECKYRFKNNGHDKSGCPIIDANIWMDDDDFCSHGERKEGTE